MTRPLLEHRIPGHPDFHYLPAAGGLWLWHAVGGFVGVFTTADLARYFGEET